MSVMNPHPQSPTDKDKSLLPISLAVLVSHAVFIAWALFFESSQPPKPSFIPRKVVVQTVNLSPQSIAVAEQPLALAPKVESPVQAIESMPEEEEVMDEAPTPPVPPTPSPPAPPKPAQKAESKPEPKSEPKPKPVEPKKAPPKPAPKTEPKKTPPKKEEKKAPVPPKKSETPKKEPSKPKTTTPPATPKNDEAEQKKKAVAEEQAKKAKQNELLAKAQERIAKISKSADKAGADKRASVSLTNVPQAITSLHVDNIAIAGNTSTMSAQELSYRDELAGRLKLLLKLPEVGEVKLKLTLDSSGKVNKVVVIGSESTANKAYIEKTLPTLTFPAFGTNFGSEDKHTFSITLSNEL